MTAPSAADPVGREHAVSLELSRLLRISPRFVRAFASRFAERSAANAFPDRPELAAAVAETREWRIVPFPPLPPAPLQGFPQEEVKPDLMIAGIGGGRRWVFQLIVEVKLETPLEELWLGGRRYAQPAVYAAVWDQIRAQDAADLRYLGTLSPARQPGWLDDFAALAPVHVRPARDVLWAPELDLSVREALREMPGGERARFLPELRHFLEALHRTAPGLGLHSHPLRPLALRRAVRRRARAAARTR